MSITDFPIAPRWPIEHRAYTGFALDDLNNEIPAWDDPSTELVFTVRLTTTQTFSSDYRSRGEFTSREATEGIVTYPPERRFAIRDRFTIDGTDYEIDQITDLTKHFLGWAPGLVARIKRITPKGRPL